MANSAVLKERLGARLLEHFPVGESNGIGTGGVADYYILVTTIPDLISAVEVALVAKVPFFILGKGAGILWSDSGFPGLVIHNQTQNIASLANLNQLIVDSGTALDALVQYSASHSLSGLEFLVDSPGTVGGAIYGNSSGFGKAISQYVRNVTLLDIDSDGGVKIRRVDAGWWQFGYRTSRLKKLKNKSKKWFTPIILTATFQLMASKPEAVLAQLHSYKQKRIYKPKSELNLEMFLNPDAEQISSPSSHDWVCPVFPAERTAGYFLEKVDAKQIKQGPLRVANSHANYLERYGNATSGQVRELVNQLKEKVSVERGVNLDESFEYVGVWNTLELEVENK